jgi:hypothetical protein
MSVDPWPSGLVQGRSCRSEGWEFGVVQPWWGKGAGLEDWRYHGVQSSSSVGLWGVAWRAALGILLVYGGVERPSMS